MIWEVKVIIQHNKTQQRQEQIVTVIAKDIGEAFMNALSASSVYGWSRVSIEVLGLK
jgi:hypothetical protein